MFIGLLYHVFFAAIMICASEVLAWGEDSNNFPSIKIPVQRVFTEETANGVSILHNETRQVDYTYTGRETNTGRGDHRAVSDDEYVAKIANARIALDAGNRLIAKDLLLSVNENSRQWEWGQIMARLDPSVLSLTMDDCADAVITSDNNSLVVLARGLGQRDVSDNQLEKNLALSIIDIDSRRTTVAVVGDGSHGYKVTLTGQTYILWDVSTGDLAAVLSSGQPTIKLDSGGKIFASPKSRESDIKSVTLWDVHSGIELFNLPTARSTQLRSTKLGSIAFSPSSNVLAIPSPTKTEVTLVDLDQFKVISSIGKALNFPVMAIEYSPNGQYLFIRSSNIAEIWSTDSLELVATQRLNSNNETRIMQLISPDGTRVAWPTRSNVVLWDLVEMGEIASIPTPTTDVKFGSNSQILLTVTLGQLVAWNANTGKKLYTVNRDDIRRFRTVELVCDGTRVAYADDTAIKLVSIESGNGIAKMKGHGEENIRVFSGNGGRYLASLSKDGFWGRDELKLWDCSRGDAFIEIDTGDRLWNFAVDESGDRVFCANKNTTTVWDVSTGKKLRSIDARPIIRPEISTQGNFLVKTPEGDGLFDEYGNTIRLVSNTDDRVYSYAFAEKSNTLATVHKGGGLIRFWDLSDESKNTEIEQNDSGLKKISINHLGDRIATIGDHVLTIWNVETKAKVRTHEHKDRIKQCIFDQSGDHLATVAGRHVRIWNQSKGYEVESVTLRYEPKGVVFLPGKQKIAIVSGHRISILSIGDGKMCSIDYSITSPGIAAIAGHPSGNRIATSHLGGTVRIWDTNSCTEILALYDSDRAFRHLKFSQDGRKLIGQSEGGRIYVWDSVPGVWSD